MLMAKCRTLQEENEEIGREASEGKVSQVIFVLSPVWLDDIDLQYALASLCEDLYTTSSKF